MEKIKIGGIMQSDGRAMVRLVSLPAEPEVLAVVTAALGEGSVNIELLVECFDSQGIGNLSFVIDQKDLDGALSIMERIKDRVKAEAVSQIEDVAVISIFGPHLREKPLVPGRMFSALASVKVGTLAVATSISSLSCVVRGDNLEAAVEALDEVFDAPFQVKKRPKEY